MLKNVKAFSQIITDDDHELVRRTLENTLHLQYACIGNHLTDDICSASEPPMIQPPREYVQHLASPTSLHMT